MYQCTLKVQLAKQNLFGVIFNKVSKNNEYVHLTEFYFSI